MMNKLESYTTLESFNSMRLGFDGQFDKIYEKFNSIPINDDLTKAINLTKQYVERQNDMNSQKRDCFKDKNELQK